MRIQINHGHSVPAQQLCGIGTSISQKTISVATQKMSNIDLGALDAEISLFIETGLVGVKMSKLLLMLQQGAIEHKIAA